MSLSLAVRTIVYIAAARSPPLLAPPHVLRQVIHCCRNFGTVSLVGVYGGFVDKVPMGSAINRGLTFRMGQTPVQRYLPQLLERISKGEIDPAFSVSSCSPKGLGAISRCRKLRLDGVDPIAASHAQREQFRLEAARAITFKEAAESYIKDHEDGRKNEKHLTQWRNTLATYAYPVFGAASVQDVDVALVIEVLDPIWKEKPETASRLRGRIEVILDWATVRGYRKGDNPARWRGYLENALPERSKIKPIVHHPALHYTHIAAFLERVREQSGVAASALELLILSACRTSEVIGATWQEIDLDQKVWTIPAERMKAGKEHRVPLSSAAVKLLRTLSDRRTSDFVFPGKKACNPFVDPRTHFKSINSRRPLTLLLNTPLLFIVRIAP